MVERIGRLALSPFLHPRGGRQPTFGIAPPPPSPCTTTRCGLLVRPRAAPLSEPRLQRGHRRSWREIGLPLTSGTDMRQCLPPTLVQPIRVQLGLGSGNGTWLSFDP